MSEDNQNEGGGLKKVMDKASDMVGGMVGMASASTAGSHSGAAFAANAGMGDLYEIEAGRIALQKARSDAVREFAAMMIEHHTTSMHQMQSALMSSEVTRDLPDLKPVMELDNRRQGMIQHLMDAPDDDFDKMYLDQQRLAHQETATLLSGYAENGDNPQLQSVAIGALPMVERHAKMIGRLGAPH
jgi:putative membrane protein